MAGATEGIRIAFNSQAFNPSPTWVRVDGGVGLSPHASQSTAAWTVDRGRQFQLDATQTGTATITLLDTTGMFDATNASGPFYTEIGPMRQVNIQLQNPVNNFFYNIFTGFTESWDYTYPATPASVIMQAVVNCVDGFDSLARAELPPDPTGTTTIPPFVGAGAIAQRIAYILNFFTATYGYGMVTSYPTDFGAVFSGNVNTLGSVYNPQTSLLTALMDTADAESGGIANNLFMDKYGNVAFRGRAARFQPEDFQNVGPPTLSKPITFWTVGDAGAAATLANCAPYFDIEWAEDDTRLINAATCYPGGSYNAAQINGQVVTATSYTVGTNSIQKYGPRTHSVPDLYTAGSPASTSNPFLNPAGQTALQETKMYAQSIVDNFCLPVPVIRKIVFKTVAPGGSAGNAWWNLVTGVELGDVITLYLANPGGGGFSRQESGFAVDQFIVEGIHYSVAIGGPYPQVTMSLDVSSRQWSNWWNGYSFYPTKPS
jgi:hypothetical protein